MRTATPAEGANPAEGAAPAKGLAPVSLGERIQILDALRGFALFGILLVNVYGFAYGPFGRDTSDRWQAWYDTGAHGFVSNLVEGKFFVIFSFLFGVGFSVQLTRATARGQNLGPFYRRRLGVLLGIGVLHSILLWTGDILRIYALLGLVLLAFRTRRDRTVLIWAVSLLAVSAAVTLALSGEAQAGSGEHLHIAGTDMVRWAQDAHQGDLAGLVGFQAVLMPTVWIAGMIGNGFSVLAMFLLGLLAGRRRIFERLPENRGRLVRVLVVAAALGGGLQVAGVLAGGGMTEAVGAVAGPVLATAYGSALCLLWLTVPGRRLLQPLAAAGRMALSNYIGQSVVCAALFSGYVVHLFQDVAPGALLALAVTLFAVQVPLSRWWLARFRFGPVEWAWRSLTYRRRQPMRLTGLS